MTDKVINVTIDPAFSRMLQRQRTIQTVHMGGDPATMSPGVLANYIRTQAFALMAEVYEAVDETHWKPWATPPEGAPVIIDRERYTSELADVFIFTMNLLLAGDVSMMELAQAVDAKQTKNIQRQVEGYDGKQSKCPACKRAFDDAGVKCYRVLKGATSESWAAWCENANGFVDAGGHLA